MNSSIQTEERELIEACIKGRQKAQEQLYKRFASKMFGLCLRYSSNTMEAEDTLHEGFMKVFLNLEKFQFRGSLEGWIKRIMMNTALRKFREDKYRRHFTESVDAVSDVIEDSREYGFQNLTVEETMKMVQQLAPGYKVVFNMYAIEGYSHREIGEMLNISENTSKSQLSRARAILQKMIARANQEKYV